jgi:hypothetical protein
VSGDTRVFLLLFSLAQYRLMPPGQHRIVLTATKAFYLGGHFYAYNTMALTMIARLVKKHSAQRVTNQDLPMEYTFAIMASGLRRQPADRSMYHPLSWSANYMLTYPA